MSLEAFCPRRWCSGDFSGGTTKVRFWSGLVVLCHPQWRSKSGSLESPAAGVARPPYIELSPGSMSQSNLGEELSRSSRIRQFLMFGVHSTAAVLRRGVLHGGGSFGVVRWAPLLTSANVRPELEDM